MVINVISINLLLKKDIKETETLEKPGPRGVTALRDTMRTSHLWRRQTIERNFDPHGLVPLGMVVYICAG